MNTDPEIHHGDLRYDRVLERARAVRERLYARGLIRLDELDAVAESEGIVLARIAGPFGKDAGFAHIHFTARPTYIESLARPGEAVRVWGETSRQAVRSIIINPNAGFPEREIFWHEYYHLFYSPNGIQRSERFEHAYSTEGVLHHQEERRADEFAAAMLIDPLDAIESVAGVIEQFGVSERLALRALELRQRLQRLR